MSWRGWAGAIGFACAYSLLVLRTLILDMWANSGDRAAVELAASYFVYGAMCVVLGFGVAAVFARLVWPDVQALVARLRVRLARRKVASDAR